MTPRHYSPHNVAIVATEAIWIGVTLCAAVAIDLVRQHADLSADQAVGEAALAMLLYLAGFYYCDLYNFTATQVRREFVSAVLRAFSALAVLFGVIFLWVPPVVLSADTMLVHLMLTLGFVLVMRPRVDAMLTRLGVVTKIAIVGTGSEARQLAQEILRRHEYGHQVSCFVGASAAEPVPISAPNPGVKRVPVIAASALLEVAQQQGIRRILVATDDVGGALPVEELLRCKTAGYGVEDGHTFYERLLGRIFIAGLSPQWLIFSDGFARPMRARLAKRVIDMVTATLLLIVSAPLCVLVALAIKLEDGGAVLFQQVRAGRRGVPFTLYKFRSMRADAEADTGPKWAEEDDPRVTRIGRWIRRLRIDEIPQVWNVLCGEMSFVGPRPERPEFVEQLRALIPYYEERLAVPPGITGWAQVNYPYGATIDDARCKLEYDLYYLKNFSVLMDAFIMLRTIKILALGWGSR